MFNSESDKDDDVVLTLSLDLIMVLLPNRRAQGTDDIMHMQSYHQKVSNAINIDQLQYFAVISLV